MREREGGGVQSRGLRRAVLPLTMLTSSNALGSMQAIGLMFVLFKVTAFFISRDVQEVALEK